MMGFEPTTFCIAAIEIAKNDGDRDRENPDEMAVERKIPAPRPFRCSSTAPRLRPGPGG
jgi:hypothetical protein